MRQLARKHRTVCSLFSISFVQCCRAHAASAGAEHVRVLAGAAPADRARPRALVGCAGLRLWQPMARGTEQRLLVYYVTLPGSHRMTIAWVQHHQHQAPTTHKQVDRSISSASRTSAILKSDSAAAKSICSMSAFPQQVSYKTPLYVSMLPGFWVPLRKPFSKMHTPYSTMLQKKHPSLRILNWLGLFSSTSGDVRATCTYLIFLPSSNDVIYFSPKNNTYVSFPSIKNNVNYYPSKTNNNTNYGWVHVQSKVKCVPKKSSTRIQESGYRKLLV